MYLLIIAFILCEITVFALGYTIAKNKYLALCEDRSWLQQQQLELSKRNYEQSLEVKKIAEKEMAEFIEKRGIKFHESLEKQPLLMVPKSEDFKSQIDVFKFNSKVILDERRNSDTVK